jgi:hypothetical protein
MVKIHSIFRFYTRSFYLINEEISRNSAEFAEFFLILPSAFRRRPAILPAAAYFVARK